MDKQSEENLQELARYYETLPGETGFSRKCRMNLPEGLQGMRIVDVGCRSGRGVLKLADRAGSDGFVLGIDWLPQRVEAARAKYGSHQGTSRPAPARDDGTAPHDYLLAYPEALDAAGIGEAEFDAVFVNSSLNLFRDIPLALAQVKRCLKPGGLLIVDGVFADAPRDERVVQQARAIGNGVQAAPFLSSFLQLLCELGFSHVTVTPGETVAEDAGFTDDTVVACVDNTESVGFKVFVIQARKEL